MPRSTFVLLAATASLSLTTAAVAGETPSTPAVATNQGAASQPVGNNVPRKAIRRIGRAGTSTAGAQGFLPGLTFLSAVFAGTSVAATAGTAFGLPGQSNPASPE